MLNFINISAVLCAQLCIFYGDFRLRTLPLSFLRAHTVLISKSDNANKLRLVTGHRSISLYNVDYKIYPEVVTNCLQTVLHGVVGEHQAYLISTDNL